MFYRNQFSSVAQSCPTLCDPINCSMPGLPVHHQLPEFTQTHVHQVSDAINHLILRHPLLLLPSIFPASGFFLMSQFFASGGQRTGVSASASVIPMNIQDWFPLGWTDLISLQSKGLSSENESESHSVMSNSFRPHGLYSPWDSPGQKTGVGSLSLLQGIFPTQGSNPGLLHWQVDSLPPEKASV